MHPGLKIALTVGSVFGFLLASVMWEIAVAKLLIWWWTELWENRSFSGGAAPLINFLMVAFMSFCVIPHFFWAPVTIAKEVIYVVKEYLRNQPYQSRHA